MAWIPPANRSNQHIKQHRFQLYELPKSDKLGTLTTLTQQANTVLKRSFYKYRVGLRVSGIYRREMRWVNGVIQDVYEGMGQPVYVVLTDNDMLCAIDERDIRQVLSIQEVAA